MNNSNYLSYISEDDICCFIG